MYKCGVCGGIIEELGEMAVTNGGCVCAQKKAEESANSLQQLKAEIAALATELQDFNDRQISAFGRVTEIVAKMRQLSAV